MLPTRVSGVGKDYRVSDLYEDQCKIVAVVMDKLQEFLQSNDLTHFEPLRMTINGASGSGKSVVINTLVTLFRKMMEFNEVIRVMAPTEAAAFNLGGHSTANKPLHYSYRPMSMSATKRKVLIQKFKMLLCVIVEKRSLAQCKDLGTMGRKIGETIFDGGPLIELDPTLGGLPILILVGDDKPGAFSAFRRREGCKMEAFGRDIVLTCGQFLMDLRGSKTVNDDKAFDKGAMKERDELVPYLRKNTRKCHLSGARRGMVLLWAESNRVSEKDLRKRIKMYEGAKLHLFSKNNEGEQQNI